MSQAILILAHKDVDYIYYLSMLLKQKFNVYVHFDTKFNLSQESKNKFIQKDGYIENSYNEEIKDFDYCLIEHITYENSIVEKQTNKSKDDRSL